MNIVNDAHSAEQAGYSAGYNGRDADSCPYQASTSPLYDFWMAGYKRAVAQAERAREAARRREADKAAFEEALTKFLGGDEFRESFEQWLAEFVDARTR